MALYTQEERAAAAAFGTYVTNLMTATKQHQADYTKAYGAVHPSNLIANGRMCANSLANITQVTTVEGAVGSTWHWVENMLRDHEDVCVIAPAYIGSQMTENVGAEVSDRITWHEPVMEGKWTLPSSCRVLIFFPSGYDLDSRRDEVKWNVCAMIGKLIPDRDITKTGLDIVHIR